MDEPRQPGSPSGIVQASGRLRPCTRRVGRLGRGEIDIIDVRAVPKAGVSVRGDAVPAGVKRRHLGRHLLIVSLTVSPWTDAPDDVLGRAQRGESEAFRALVDIHHAELVRVAYAVCGDVEIACDAVQAAWVKAWRQLPSLRDPARLRPWLVSIACNEARQAVRARRRRSVREVAMPEEGPTGAEPSADGMDLARALARLAPDDRALLAMRYLVGLGSDEIGRVTGRSASGTRARLSRLVSRLREDLSDD